MFREHCLNTITALNTRPQISPTSLSLCLTGASVHSSGKLNTAKRLVPLQSSLVWSCGGVWTCVVALVIVCLGGLLWVSLWMSLWMSLWVFCCLCFCVLPERCCDRCRTCAYREKCCE